MKVAVEIFHHQRELFRGEGLRTIIAGTREGESAGVTYAYAMRCILRDVDWKISHILSGANRGRWERRRGKRVKLYRSSDEIGELIAARHDIALEQYPADWQALGRRAGPVRNAQMIGLADALIAFPGKGNGTRGIIELAKREQRERPFRLAVFDAPGGFVDDGESAVDAVTYAMLAHHEI